MSYSLLRNSRVFFTTAVDTEGKLNANFTPNDTYELQVLDGLSFSQNTTSETVTINEAGSTPTRGQLAYNTALEPVDWSFSTYLRPSASFTTRVTCEERVLWNAMASTTAVTATGFTPAAGGWREDTNTNGSLVTFAESNVHQLQRFALIITMDNTSYIMENCAIESVSIDFGIDAIATAAWTGRAFSMRMLTTAPTFTANAVGTVTGITVAGRSGGISPRDISPKYIANKLSVTELTVGVNQSSGASTYNVAITGGNITIANNLTYLTPANINVVNEPCTYFTGTRSVSGSLNAYLRTGTNNTANLLNAVIGSKSEDQNAWSTAIRLGGTTGQRVVFNMTAAQLQIPTVSTDQVVSTTINFTGHANQGTGTVLSDTVGPLITGTNELTVRYFAS